MKQCISCMILVLLLLSLSASSGCYDKIEGTVNNKNYTENELLIKFKETPSEFNRENFFKDNEFFVIEVFESIDVYRIRLPEKMTVEKALNICNSDANIEYAEPKYHRQLMKTKDDATSEGEL